MIERDDTLEIRAWQIERHDGAVEVRCELRSDDAELLESGIDRLVAEPLADTIMRV